MTHLSTKSKLVPPGIHIFTLNRPDSANALDLFTAKNLAKALNEAVKNKCFGFIITSRSKDIFCSGGDLKVYRSLKKKSEGVSINRQIAKVLNEFKKAPLFTLAALEGDAIGGGCELALACDFILASDRARFSFKQAEQSLTPGWGGMTHLLNRVPPSKALNWLSSAKWISAFEAHRLGLVDELSVPGKVLECGTKVLQNQERKPIFIKKLKELAYSQGRNEQKIFEEQWWSKSHLEVLRDGKLTHTR